jgi:hypothetical protein
MSDRDTMDDRGRPAAAGAPRVGEAGSRPAKVFGVGLQRTGTSSLTRALNLLDIPTVQFPKELHRDLDHEIIDRFQGFTDSPIPLIYPELDRRHPGSRFIHTLRDESEWLASIEWLFTTGTVKFKESHERYGDEMNREIFGRSSFDREHFLDVYRKHNREVAAYFAERPGDYLAIDVTAGDGFEALCAFLGVPIPEIEFPNKNRREARLCVYGGRAYRALRRLLQRPFGGR